MPLTFYILTANDWNNSSILKAQAPFANAHTAWSTIIGTWSFSDIIIHRFGTKCFLLNLICTFESDEKHKMTGERQTLAIRKDQITLGGHRSWITFHDLNGVERGKNYNKLSRARRRRARLRAMTVAADTHTKVNPRRAARLWTPVPSDQRSSQTYGNSF